MVSSRVKLDPECRRSKEMRKATPDVSLRQDTEGPRGVIDPRHAQKQPAREPGDPLFALERLEGRVRKPKGVADDERAGEVGRKGSTREVSEQSRTATGRGGDGGKRSGQRETRNQQNTTGYKAGSGCTVRWSGYVNSMKDKKIKFTSLMHHIESVDTLREAYYSLKREASAGIDGETWKQYGEELEENLQDLSERLKRGVYRAKPVRRTYIPKADGRQRPLGVPVLEDKIVQYAAVLVLNAIYETDVSRILVRLPAWTQPASLSGRALYRNADEESELGASMPTSVDFSIRSTTDGW